MDSNSYQTKVNTYMKLIDYEPSNGIETHRRIRALSEADKYWYDTKKFAGCIREERVSRYDKQLDSIIK